MILVDTSVWVDHFRETDPRLGALVDDERLLMHPFVLGELALGTLRQRGTILRSLARLPRATRASDDEVLGLIERHALPGSGIGYVDAHLVASVRLISGARLWTHDKRLHAVAARLSIAAPMMH